MDAVSPRCGNPEAGLEEAENVGRVCLARPAVIVPGTSLKPGEYA